MQDDFARWVAAAGLLLGAVSLFLTWYLWQRGGPKLRVTAFVKAEAASIHIEVTSVGRLAATVRAIELRDQTLINPQASSQNNVVVRWTMNVLPRDRDGAVIVLPKEDLAPTAYLEADVPIAEVIERAQGAPQISLVAFAWRGDGVVSSSRALRIR